MSDKRILVIDDEPDILMLVDMAFKNKNYDIETANNGAEGLERVYAKRPDLIIVDLMMPVLSGLEFCKKIRSEDDYKDIPIIVMSALGSKSDKPEEFWTAGLNSDDFIAKPFDPLALLTKAEYILRRDSYVSSGASPSAPAVQPADEYPDKAVDVVKMFIESWNTQDFALEHKALGKVLTGGLSSKEYIARRKQCYIDTNGDNRKQYFEEVISDKSDNFDATIICKRSDAFRGHKKFKREEYTLQKEKGHWVITMVKSKSI